MAEGAVALDPMPLQTLLNLRGRPDAADFRSAVAGLLGAELPLTPDRWQGGENDAILWLGPDEWLVMAGEGRAGELDAGLREALADDPWLSVVDLSHSYTGFRLTGPAAREVLAKGCPLDLHPRVFGDGQCAQSILAGSRILLRAVGTPVAFELWVRNSFAAYASAWLQDAMAEFAA